MQIILWDLVSEDVTPPILDTTSLGTFPGAILSPLSGPWLSLQRAASTPRVEENTEVKFQLCPCCLTLTKSLPPSASSSTSSLNVSHP